MPSTSGSSEIRGVLVRGFPDSVASPAEKAGLEQGDVIISIDGKPVDYVAQLQQVVGFREPGEIVKVEVARKGGVRKTFNVRLMEQKETAQLASAGEGSAGTAQDRCRVHGSAGRVGPGGDGGDGQGAGDEPGPARSVGDRRASQRTGGGDCCMGPTKVAPTSFSRSRARRSETKPSCGTRSRRPARAAS